MQDLPSTQQCRRKLQLEALRFSNVSRHIIPPPTFQAVTAQSFSRYHDPIEYDDFDQPEYPAEPLLLF
jgi:hypothetical protein